LTTIPFHELALQTTLLFSPISSDVAANYLQAIALHEGAFLSTSYTHLLCQTTRVIAEQGSLLDQPLAPGQHVIHSGVDLRAAIMQLQVDTAGKQAITNTCRADSTFIPLQDPFVSCLEDLSHFADKLEALSVADVWLPISLQTQLEVGLGWRSVVSLPKYTDSAPHMYRSPKSTD
jgi:hypothetical protein